jgi:glycosyltransferase involved in cell wall biosynthesis
MKILHTEASSGWGGQEIRILTESQVFIKNGHEVMVAANPSSHLYANAKEYGVTCYPANINKIGLQQLTELIRLINKLKPDIVSTHSSKDHWLSALAKIFCKHKFGLVRTRHISVPLNKKISTRWLFGSMTDGLMTTGTSITNELIKNGNVSEQIIKTVPTGIDTDHFKPGNKINARTNLNIPINNYVYGIVATLRSWKGHEYLFEAFSQLHSKDKLATLVIVGEGPEGDYLQNLAKKKYANLDIIFSGQQKDVLPYLTSLDCFVLPSYANEGVPQALLQAMAVGIPIISCPIGGIPEALKNYTNYILVEPKSTVQLANAMNQLKDGKICTTQINTPYTLSSMYQDALSIYEMVDAKLKIKLSNRRDTK